MHYKDTAGRYRVRQSALYRHEKGRVCRVWAKRMIDAIFQDSHRFVSTCYIKIAFNVDPKRFGGFVSTYEIGR